VSGQQFFDPLADKVALTSNIGANAVCYMVFSRTGSVKAISQSRDSIGSTDSYQDDVAGFYLKVIHLTGADLFKSTVRLLQLQHPRAGEKW
jgi:hypothetical protein